MRDLNGFDHKKILDNLAAALNIEFPEDWYKVKKEDLERYGVKSLLKKYYNYSLYKVLNIVL